MKRTRFSSRSFFILTVLPLLVLSGCKKDDEPEGPSPYIGKLHAFLGDEHTKWEFSITGETFGTVTYNITTEYDLGGRVSRQSGTITTNNRTYTIDAVYARYDGAGWLDELNLTVSGGLLSPTTQSMALTRPHIAATVPDTNAVDAEPTSSITATFTKSMDSTTINAGSFILQEEGTGANIVGSVTCRDRVATFKPTQTLKNMTGYTAFFSSIVRDAGGNYFAGHLWTFRTFSGPPIVVSTSPAHQEPNVPINARIRVTFAKRMNSSTINNSSFFVKDDQNNTISGSITASGTSAEFVPASFMAYNERYTVTITKAVQDYGGTPMTNDTSWNFITLLEPQWIKMNDASAHSLSVNGAAPSTLLAIFSGDSLLMKSTDWGKTWSNISAQRPVSCFAYSPSNHNHIYYITINSDVYRSTNGGNAWNFPPRYIPTYETRCLSVSKSAPALLFAGSFFDFMFQPTSWHGVFRSTNYGDYWTHVMDSNDVACIAIDPSDAQKIYVGTYANSWSKGGVFRSTDGGETWIHCYSGHGRCLAIHPTNPNIIYAATDYRLIRTTDGGVTWRATSYSGDVCAVVFDPVAPGTIYVADKIRGITKMVGDLSSTIMNTGLGDIHVKSLAIDPVNAGVLYVSTNDGLYFWKF